MEIDEVFEKYALGHDRIEFTKDEYIEVLEAWLRFEQSRNMPAALLGGPRTQTTTIFGREVLVDGEPRTYTPRTYLSQSGDSPTPATGGDS